MSETALIHPPMGVVLEKLEAGGRPFDPKSGRTGAGAWTDGLECDDVPQIKPSRTLRIPPDLVAEVSQEEVLVRGTRVPLECVIYAYRDSSSAEEIMRTYPSLPLAKVYAILAYYVDHRSELDGYVSRVEAFRRRSREERAAQPSPLVAKLKKPGALPPERTGPQ